MNCEIKYRGKTNDSEWVYGLPSYNNNNGNISEIESFVDKDMGCSFVEVDPKTVGRYTEMHDDSDDENDIYECDIIRFNYKDKEYIGFIDYCGGTPIIGCGKLPDGYITMLEIAENDSDYFWIDGVVIGNKFETPELFKRTL